MSRPPATLLRAALLAGVLALSASLVAMAPADVSTPDRTPAPAFAHAHRTRLALLTVTDELQADDRGQVIVHVARRGTCGLVLAHRGRRSSGPYRVRARAPYLRWSWRVAATARGGAWRAIVTCRSGGQATRRSSRILVGVTAANRSSVVARHSMHARASAQPPGPLGGRRSGKGGGSYPDDGALCEWTGTRSGAKGHCTDYAWGYRQPNGRWQLLSQRGFYYRNCTDYVAWFMGLTWDGFHFPTGLGNAVDWKAYAGNVGLQVASAPSVGDIAWWGSEKAGGYGHVAVVTAVDASGAVTIAEYNGDGHGDWDLRPNVRADAYLHRPGDAAPTTPPPTQTPTTPTQPTPTPTPTTPAPTPTPTPTPAATTWAEQEGHFGVNTFTNPANASGMGPKIPPAAVVQVSCKVYAPQIASANPDGYWYRIASAPWSNAYYSPANTFMNGDPWSGPYSHNTDFAVPNC